MLSLKICKFQTIYLFLLILGHHILLILQKNFANILCNELILSVTLVQKKLFLSIDEIVNYQTNALIINLSVTFKHIFVANIHSSVW